MIAAAVCAANDWLKARVLCCRRCRAMLPPLKQAETAQTKIYGCQSGSLTLGKNPKLKGGSNIVLYQGEFRDITLL